MFLDHATIDVIAGAGGRGCVSWRREKYVPKGGPDGGDGGWGGDVIMVANDDTDTLSTFASRKKFEAPIGRFGSGSNKRGRDGEDLILPVPPGTIVTEILEDGTERVIADLSKDGEQMVVAKGGRGGYGNAHFVSSVRQRPDFAELGEPGERRKLRLELKLVADVGIIGFPSVGKSTLISVISAAKPKIADYPFTTLVPNLGVVHVGERSYVVADVPGLIEGASEGKGLGDAFLKHIERCGVLLHVLDVSRGIDLTKTGEDRQVDPTMLVRDYRAIRKELEAYSPLLAQKRELVILNKTDLVPDEVEVLIGDLKQEGIDIFTSISAATSQGTRELTQKLLPLVLEERERRVLEEAEAQAAADGETVVLQPHLDDDRMIAYRIEQQPDGSVVIRGKRLEQFTVMTPFGHPGAQKRFRDVADRIGLLKSIKRLQLPPGTPVSIGNVRVEEYL